jgi:hypothetical protein
MVLIAIRDFFRSLTFWDVYERVFFGHFANTYFLPHATLTCFYLRVSAGVTGIQSWRSFLLGLLLSYGTMYATNVILMPTFPIDQFRSVLYQYSVLWLLFNITPFDLVFRLFNRPSLIFLLGCSAEFCHTQRIFATLGMARRSLTSISSMLLYVIVPYSFPSVVDWLDNKLFEPRRRFMFIPWVYLKRVFLATAIAILVSGTPPWMTAPIVDPWSVLPIGMCGFAFLKSVDLVLTGSPVAVIDFVTVPKRLKWLFTYHAGGDRVK